MRTFEMTLGELGRFAHDVAGELAGSVTQSKLEDIQSRLSALEAQGSSLMAIAQSTQAKLDAIAAALDTAATGLAADIQALKDQLVAANNGMSEADVNAALAPLEARVQALSDLDAQNPQATGGGTSTGGGGL